MQVNFEDGCGTVSVMHAHTPVAGVIILQMASSFTHQRKHMLAFSESTQVVLSVCMLQTY